jgi:beta-lactamase class A
MITKSDNFAANALIFYECGVDINKVSDDLRIFLPNDENAENFISVIDYASYFRVLYNSSYLNREMSEWALKLLSQTDFKEGLVAGVPSYVTVSHKFGERGLPDYYQLHDCGIVYRSNSPYLLCIMTKGDGFKKMEEVISELSSRIYNNKY